MFDLKVLNSALEQLEEERGIPREKVIEAIELALAAAYKKDYGKKGQFTRATFDLASGLTTFSQVKVVVDESMLKDDDETDDNDGEISATTDSTVPKKVRFNEEHHIMLTDAKRIKKDVGVGDELVFPLETRDDFGRIAAQTAKQVIIQKIREAEKISVVAEYGKHVGNIVSGNVQRVERGNVYVDLGRATGILHFTEQIPGEHYRQGERIKAYLMAVDETPRGISLKLSRAHPALVTKLFAQEAPEIASGVVEIKVIAREPGSRTKMAIVSHDPNIDPVGACVGQHGVRVSTVISELGGEKIDVIPWSDTPEQFIANALQPGRVLSIELDEELREAKITVTDDQLSLVIGKGGQNVRLAAKLSGYRLDITTPTREKQESLADEDDGIDRGTDDDIEEVAPEPPADKKE